MIRDIWCALNSVVACVQLLDGRVNVIPNFGDEIELIGSGMPEGEPK